MEILVLIMVNLGMIIRIMHKNYLTFKTGSCTFSRGETVFSGSFCLRSPDRGEIGETEGEIYVRVRRDKGKKKFVKTGF